MFVLLIVIFLYNGTSQAEIVQAPSLEACQTAVPDFKARVETDPRVQSVTLQCLTIPKGDKI